MSRTVLVVDDSLTVRMDLADALQDADVPAVVAGTLAEAREALTAHDIGLVILDVLLPDGDGVDFLAELKGRALALPVLMLSSENEVRDRVRALTTGADEYVGKPYDAAYVVARVRDLLPASTARVPGRTAILVIDDSATARDVLRVALEGAGYDVLTAASGVAGLRLAATVRPEAIVVDGYMPDLDGAAVIRRLRLDEALRRTPCLLLTASHDRSAEPQALEAGADAFVRKDEDSAVILARVAAMLRSSQAGEPARTDSLLGPKRILAIDDSATYLDVLTESLSSEGFEVVPARSGEEALDLLAVQPVDCILLDVLMPGLSGHETCRRIKESQATRDIPLIMLTALEDRNALIQGLSSGADDYISKSSELEVLKARVRAQLRRRQFEDENRRIREELLRKELEAAEERAARRLAETRAALAEELERKNQELEAFSYSVSHDLRAPLRSIDGFSQALLEDHVDRLDERGRHYLDRVRGAAQRMGQLIDDLLELSRVSRAELVRQHVDLTELSTLVAENLARAEPAREVALEIERGLRVEGDARLLRVMLENLLGNAWKFTVHCREACLAVGRAPDEPHTFFVRDNGAGFDPAYAGKLFNPFQRLHAEADFPGTGIGLAIVNRIVDRHGGRIRATGAVDQGATFVFTLPPGPEGDAS